MSRIVYVNGDYVPEEQGKVSIFDRGFLFADGVYEVTAVIGGKLVDYDPHMERLERSLTEIQMAWPCSKAELRAMHDELIKRNKLDQGLIYMQVTRGAADRDFKFPKDVAVIARRLHAGEERRRQSRRGDGRQGRHHSGSPLGAARHQIGHAARPGARQAAGL